MATRADALQHLRQAMATPAVDFRDGQWEAIDYIVNQRGKVLCVQRTGWGKSMVYFVSAKLMRAQGAGVTLIISPLLALMRNQMEAAQRLGLRALTVNSTNRGDWHHVRDELLADRVDLLLISPERLANDEFVADTLQPIAARIGLLVIDEAHCISDWGHDFRPDYRRIGQVLARLPRNIAVLATTATANRRVEQDVAAQLGGAVAVQRGPLIRESLALQNMRMPGPADRLAWLADHIPGLPGSGIVYTLTTRDADRVAEWLCLRGVDAHAYHAGKSDEERQALEQALLANNIKCLVATTALGMGYDKPDLTFVIHYQTPGNVVAYYQQVGRAGRAIPAAYGVLLSGEEEDDINEYFRDSAFPPEWQVNCILEALEGADEGMKVREIEHAVNLRQSQIEKVLKLLVVEPQSPVMRIDGTWYRTPNPFQLDRQRVQHLTHQREAEWEQMKDYLANEQCLMQFLADALDDPGSTTCGRCVVCLGHPVLSAEIQRQTYIAAQQFVRHSEMPLELKKQWDLEALGNYQAAFGWSRQNIPQPLRGDDGRVLSRWGEPVWGELVTQGKAQGRFDDELVTATVDLIRQRWPEAAVVRWVTCIPSNRHPNLVPDFAARLAAALGVPFLSVISKTRETAPQKNMENRFHQCHNLDGAFEVLPVHGMNAPVLLVDDVVDSAWTLTLAAALLRQAGTPAVFPFALATTAAK
ncbi:RecQ family ATP-dependent DNA helicase [Chromobacterium violaceum]|uniref:RecQ family ATP-dependent DNA helicase n=1 Tax=Chromobacterium violaceum TaxID=536 RepID=UPI0005D375B1|nr:RecQ family ATP-dependent DNA helicase [Chromobacterium violaceum]KJH67398.1 ATP-dependent DNA helicase RecG [Chromobacterium violaceum]